MGRLKIKDIEGDAPDVSNLFQIGRCDLASYLGAEEPPKKISNLWIWMIAGLFFILASCVWVDIFNEVWTKVAILGLFALCFLLLLMVHYNFKNWSLTVITGFAELVLILVALNVYPPQEIARRIEKTTVKKYEESK